MNAYITLDYELFMGVRTGAPENCLIKPMEALSAMCKKYSIPLNVFVDAAYLLKLYELRNVNSQLQYDFNTITNNIRNLDKEGHAIQLHLHPQWTAATFENGKWILPPMPYKLSDMPISAQQQLIKDGVCLLNSLITRKVSAFRAGGYSFDNYSELRNTLLGCGINKDTSVLRGEYVKEKYHSYDYRKVPSRTSYPIGNSLTEVDFDSNMIEYPISTIVVTPIAYLINKHCKKQKGVLEMPSAKFGDGVPISIPGGSVGKLKHKIGQLFGTKCLRASIEEPKNLERVLAHVKKHYEGDDFVIIGHPKNISHRSIFLLEQFVISHPELEFKTL